MSYKALSYNQAQDKPAWIKDKAMGHEEIKAIYEAIEAMPEGDYFDELTKGLLSAITLIRTHVLDENDLEAIN